MIVLVCAGRNCESYIERCLTSIESQRNKNFFVHFVLDEPQDRSKELFEAAPKNFPHIMFYNQERMYALYNKSVLVYKMCRLEDDDIIVGLDLDDMFLNPDVIDIIIDIFTDPNVWMSYGGIAPLNKKWRETKAGTPMQWNVPVRVQDWRASQLRAVRWSLLKNVLKKDMTNGNGEWLKYPEDRILSYPCLEMAGPEHVYCYQGPPLYGLNNDYEESDHNKHGGAIKKEVERLITAKPYPRKTKAELIEHECDW